MNIRIDPESAACLAFMALYVLVMTAAYPALMAALAVLCAGYFILKACRRLIMARSPPTDH